MNTLTPDTINFAAKAIVIVLVLCAGVVAPAAGLAIFSKLAVRLAAPQIASELLNDQKFIDGLVAKFLGSQAFMDGVARVAEHKANGVEAKMLSAFDLIRTELAPLRKLAEVVEKMGKDVAILKDRSEGGHHA